MESKTEIFRVIASLPLPSDLTYKIFKMTRESFLDEVRENLITYDEKITIDLRSLKSEQIRDHYAQKLEKCSEIVPDFRYEAFCLINIEVFKFFLCIMPYTDLDRKKRTFKDASQIFELMESAFNRGLLSQERYLKIVDILSKLKKLAEPVDE